MSFLHFISKVSNIIFYNVQFVSHYLHLTISVVMFLMFFASVLTFTTGPLDFIIAWTTLFLSLTFGFDMDVLRLDIFANKA